MRQWLLTAPWWALSLVGGTTYTLTSTAVGRLVRDESWPEAVVSGAIPGILFGALMGPLLARRNRRFRDAAGDIPREQHLRAAKLAQRGPVPEDPQLRRSARRVALDHRDQLLSQRRWVLPLLAALTAFLVWAALRDSEPDALSWLMIIFLLVLIAAHLVLPRHLAR